MDLSSFEPKKTTKQNKTNWSQSTDKAGYYILIKFVNISTTKNTSSLQRTFIGNVFYIYSATMK